MTDNEKLEELVAKQAITEVLYRYARGWDRYDEETIRSCFHPDSEHAHGGFTGTSQDFVTIHRQTPEPHDHEPHDQGEGRPGDFGMRVSCPPPAGCNGRGR